jgi:hypothetical protein
MATHRKIDSAGHHKTNLGGTGTPLSNCSYCTIVQVLDCLKDAVLQARTDSAAMLEISPPCLVLWLQFPTTKNGSTFWGPFPQGIANTVLQYK